VTQNRLCDCLDHILEAVKLCTKNMLSGNFVIPAKSRFLFSPRFLPFVIPAGCKRGSIRK